LAYGIRARIRPGIELNLIEIRLQPNGPPMVRCEGTVRHARTRRVIGSAKIDTVILGPAGVAFINEIKDAFTPLAEAISHTDEETRRTVTGTPQGAAAETVGCD
jgi:hypothetical protein